VTPSPEDSPISAATPAEELGQGRYVVVGSLGAGSQGETLEAVDKRQGRPVAIKRFTLRSAKSWKDVELAEREATVLAALNHPSLPRYVEHFEENGALYLVMEKVEGESLAARRRRKAPLDYEQVLRFLREAAESLAYLHGQTPPIVHRDIKPGNVILRPDGSYCLVDFGSVRDRLKPEGGSTVVGTFGFMAPEQFQGRAAPVSDVYAVGATALCLVTGREPEDLPHKGLGIDVESALRGQVDKRLIQALRSMLEPDPDKRAPSVENALLVAGLATPTPSGSSVADAAKKARRARLEAEARTASSRSGQHGYSAQEEQRATGKGQRAEREAHRYAEKVERQARKAARREERRARRYGAGHWQRPHRPVPPGIFLGIVLLLALRVASVATFALFQVLLPLLFTFLPIPGRRERMRQIGQAGQNGLHAAREHIRYHFLGGPTPTGVQAFQGDIETSGTDTTDADADATAAPRQRISLEDAALDLADRIETKADDLEAEIEALAAKAETAAPPRQRN
jgi:Protein kinase domain